MATKTHVDKLVAYSTIHGMHGTPEYRVWKGMNQRCQNPSNPNFSDYGGRGICVCPEWRTNFAQFFRDMGPRPEGATIERENNDKDYEPTNCRWATRREQANNRRVRSDNKTGVPGVVLRKSSGRFLVKSRHKYVGSFASLEDAKEAKRAADLKGLE